MVLAIAAPLTGRSRDVSVETGEERAAALAKELRVNGVSSCVRKWARVTFGIKPQPHLKNHRECLSKWPLCGVLCGPVRSLFLASSVLPFIHSLLGLGTGPETFLVICSFDYYSIDKK